LKVFKPQHKPLLSTSLTFHINNSIRLVRFFNERIAAFNHFASLVCIVLGHFLQRLQKNKTKKICNASHVLSFRSKLKNSLRILDDVPCDYYLHKKRPMSAAVV
jgi:hypothetical protein